MHNAIVVIVNFQGVNSVSDLVEEVVGVGKKAVVRNTHILVASSKAAKCLCVILVKRLLDLEKRL